MPNKLTKSKHDRELAYYKKHCSLLEKENADLKNQNAKNEINISLGQTNIEHKSQNLNTLLKNTLIAKNTYELLCTQYKSKIKILDEKISELDNIKAEYIKKMNILTTQYEKVTKKLY